MNEFQIQHLAQWTPLTTVFFNELDIEAVIKALIDNQRMINETPIEPQLIAMKSKRITIPLVHRAYPSFAELCGMDEKFYEPKKEKFKIDWRKEGF